MRRDDSTWGEAAFGACGMIIILAGVIGVAPGGITFDGPILQKLAISLGGLVIAAVGGAMIWVGGRKKDRRLALETAGRSSRRSLRRQRR